MHLDILKNFIKNNYKYSDFNDLDFLEELNVPAYKIASFEINDLPLIEYTAKKNKPVIISTGVADFNEIKDAVNVCRNTGNNDIILLIFHLSSRLKKTEKLYKKKAIAIDCLTIFNERLYKLKYINNKPNDIFLLSFVKFFNA